MSEIAVPQAEETFGVVAEVDGRQRQLVLLNLTFGRLIDEIVVPYDSGDPFFIDGVPITKAKIKRIKIIKLGQKFRHGLHVLERGLTRGDPQTRKTYGDQYESRFEHLLRTDADDVGPGDQGLRSGGETAPEGLSTKATGVNLGRNDRICGGHEDAHSITGGR